MPSYGAGRHLVSLDKEAARAYRAGHARHALALYRKILRHDRHDPILWTRTGNLEAFLGHPQAAVRAYHRAVAADRTMTEAWYNMGLVEMREAWASFIAAYATLPVGNPLRKRLSRMIKGLERMARPAPAVTAPSPHPATPPRTVPPHPAAHPTPPHRGERHAL
jgi:tetratricopeptide (TPR) repeat protein